MKVVLEVDGRAGNTFWCVEMLVMKSDWQGATSNSTNHIDSALVDLDAGVQARLGSALA